MTVGLIPGSFDPFHNGHLEVVETPKSPLHFSNWKSARQ